MKWNQLTLWQYQQIMPILQNPDKDWTELDKEVKLLTIVTGLTEHQIDSLGIQDLKELRKDLQFLDDPIEGSAVNYIKVNGKQYRINYDIKNMPFARYIESKVFSQDTVANLHKIAASMIIPQKKNWLGKWKDEKYDASKHEVYSHDMQEANFIDVYHSLVFFYQVYRNWIEVSQDYMKQEVMKAGMTEEQADSVQQLLCESMDGIIPLNLLPITKILQIRKHLT
jgi:hypothetical protein